MIEENYLKLVDIVDIEYTDTYENMVDISIDIDESFVLKNGIISHNSATSTIITGFASTGRDYFGVFPLKGKPLNVRKATMKKILDNDEIKNIISALGLEFDKKYTDTLDLRYGRLVFATDSDADGYHIKGLLINLFELFWPELLKLNFLYDFVSPIVKIEKGKKMKFFYKLSDYEKWRKTKTTGWLVTYYKGLGTIEPDEIKEFFKDVETY